MFGTKRAINERLEAMHALLERIEAALVVRDPGTARSIEAYEGLRKAVVGAMKERRQHLAQLINFSEAIERGASIETLEAKVEEWRLEAGLRRWDRPDPVEFFQVLEGEGPELEVISPAWVDDAGDGSVILVKQGTARRVAGTRQVGDWTREDETVRGTTTAATPSSSDVVRESIHSPGSDESVTDRPSADDEREGRP